MIDNQPQINDVDKKRAERADRLSRRDRTVVHNAGYSRFVRLMRLLLPLGAVLIVAILFLRSGVDDPITVPDIPKHPRVDAQDIRRNELVNPEFESMDKKNQPYKITADRAVQGDKNKDLIMLERPVGVMNMEDGTSVTMRSLTGAYRQDTERFFLEGEVSLEHTGGYVLQSEEAHIDLKQNYAWSGKAVHGTGADMIIDAQGMRINGNTGEIIFTGPAKLILKQGVEGIK